MEWRVSFFVSGAQQTDEGWLVHGEPALGPPAPGDEFSGVLHEPEGREEPATFRVVAVDGGDMRISGTHDVQLRAGDILFGVVDR
jgi:hypothetical protein